MRNSKDEWINVRYEDASRSKSRKKGGVTVRFMTSPLDVPDMWRHGIQTASSGDPELIFEFKYLATKEPIRTVLKDGVMLEVGKNSKRVYRIVIPLPKPHEQDENIEVKVELAIEEIEGLDRPEDLRQTHWDVIKGMIKQPNLQMA